MEKTTNPTRVGSQESCPCFARFQKCPFCGQALATALSEKYPIEVADQIGFHLVDWNSDAAFLIAVHLFPERFTPEEIQAGVDLFLVHVPAHVMEAARQGGYPAENIFLDDGGK